MAIEQKATLVTDEMVKAAEEAVYPRHERGFLVKPLLGAIDMRAALEAALSQPAEAVPVAWQNIDTPYSILTPEQYGMRLPMAEGKFRPLYASPAPDAGEVAVKALEWVQGTPECVYGQHSFEARPASGGIFVVRRLYSGDGWAYANTAYPTAEQAKAAAQADYEARIRSALVPATAKESGRMPSKVRYARTGGSTMEEMRQRLPADLYQLGDTILVWANEGDLCLNGQEFASSKAEG